MEDPSSVPSSEADGRADQSSDQTSSSAVREDKVPGGNGLPDYGVSSTPLDPNTKYEIWGSYVNAMYDNAVREFNSTPNPDYAQTSFAKAFWNGYGAAAAILRSTLRNYPVDPKVQ